MEKVYSDLAIRAIINHSPDLTKYYKEKYAEHNTLPTGTDWSAVEKAKRATFALICEEVGWNPLWEEVGGALVHEGQIIKKEEQAVELAVPKLDELPNQISKLITVYGWIDFSQALMRAMEEKRIRMINAGQNRQAENWHKFKETIKKLSRINAMT